MNYYRKRFSVASVFVFVFFLCFFFAFDFFTFQIVLWYLRCTLNCCGLVDCNFTVIKTQCMTWFFCVINIIITNIITIFVIIFTIIFLLSLIVCLRYTNHFYIPRDCNIQFSVCYLLLSQKNKSRSSFSCILVSCPLDNFHTVSLFPVYFPPYVFQYCHDMNLILPYVLSLYVDIQIFALAINGAELYWEIF